MIDLGRLVKVIASDYWYIGYIVAIFSKRSGVIRYVVEDDKGRLFIHNEKQIYPEFAPELINDRPR